MSMIDAEYPLRWVVGRPRTPAAQRKSATFRTMLDKDPTTGNPVGHRSVSIAVSIDRLGTELRAFGATGLIMSTNIPIRRDGLPFARVVEPEDPGAAVYFRLRDKSHGIAVDKWDRVADNITAMAKHIGALRGQERWGCGDVAQALAGFKLLTAMEERKSWWQILGFKEPPAVFSTVERAWEKLIRENHPDKTGGSSNAAAEINAAKREADTFYEKAP